MSMSEGLALFRITQPSSQLHNRTITLGYRLRRFAQPHTYDSRNIWWGVTNCGTGYLYPFEDRLRDVTLLSCMN